MHIVLTQQLPQFQEVSKFSNTKCHILVSTNRGQSVWQQNGLHFQAFRNGSRPRSSVENLFHICSPHQVPFEFFSKMFSQGFLCLDCPLSLRKNCSRCLTVNNHPAISNISRILHAYAQLTVHFHFHNIPLLSNNVKFCRLMSSILFYLVFIIIIDR